MIEQLLRCFKGYILVELQGNALERLLNRLSNLDISLWDIKRIKNGFRFKMLARDYHRLRPLIKYRKCTVRIVKKYGWPFIHYRAQRRRAFLVGVLAFLIILKTVSLFLWKIEIVGNEFIPISEIEQLIYNSGIQRGMFLKKLNLLELEHYIVVENNEISWVNATLQGTKLKIEIVEKDLIDETDLTDVIASKSGVIIDMIVMKGKPLVKKGDTVSAGQVLIKAANKYEVYAEPDFEGNLPPYLPPADEEPEPALGIVHARVWYEGYGEAECTVTQELYTGQRERILKLKIGPQIIQISGPKIIAFEHYKVEKDVKSISLWRNITLPIEIIKEDYLETAIYSERRSRDTAVFLAQEQALSSVLNSMASGAIIIQAKYYIIEDGMMENNIVRVKVILEVEENIALPLARQ